MDIPKNHSTRVAAVLMLCVPGFVGGAISSILLSSREPLASPQPNRIACKELQVESLVIVDRDGKQVGFIRATGAAGATLMLGYGEGRPMVVLQVDEVEETPTAILKVSAPEPAMPPNKPTGAAVFMSCVAGWPRFTLHASSGREIDLGSTPDNPGTAMSLTDPATGKARWPQ